MNGAERNFEKRDIIHVPDTAVLLVLLLLVLLIVRLFVVSHSPQHLSELPTVVQAWLPPTSIAAIELCAQ